MLGGRKYTKLEAKCQEASHVISFSWTGSDQDSLMRMWLSGRGFPTMCDAMGSIPVPSSR